MFEPFSASKPIRRHIQYWLVKSGSIQSLHGKLLVEIEVDSFHAQVTFGFGLNN